MPIYKNANTFAVHLIGPDGLIKRVMPGEELLLSDYYDKYVSKGYLTKIDTTQVEKAKNKLRHVKKQVELKRLSNLTKSESVPYRKNKVKKNTAQPSNRIVGSKNLSKVKRILKRSNSARAVKKTVGKVIDADATEHLQLNLQHRPYPISNNIGVGILSFERVDSLKRLITSIEKFTDLSKTTVFISDDNSQDSELKQYLNQLELRGKFIILRNDERKGVAGNSNRLLKCMERFKYGLLLNDDVEVLQHGWDNFYVKAFKKTGMHHLIYREPGIYGAVEGYNVNYNSVNLSIVSKKPHGAILAFTNDMLSKCGYFNEEYGLYGMEHIDWSSKAFEFNLQRSGFIDVIGSNKYFKIHNEKSAIESRQELFRKAKELFKNRKIEKIDYINKCLPEISYIIPVKCTDREQSIITVINNIRAQKFPIININIVEQDSKHVINIDQLMPINYIDAIIDGNELFNKSYAFNVGVKNCTTNKMILHDADMLAQEDYTQKIYDDMMDKGFSHIGRSVLYTNKEACDLINISGKVDSEVECERIVGYFEGGSLGVDKDIYWGCGGFNEDFEGYGCEDCDFYARVTKYVGYIENRTVDLLHMWHSRVGGWTRHHEDNKKIEEQLNRLEMSDRIKAQRDQLKKNGYISE